MTARYTDAEKAAAKRIGYGPVLNGGAPDSGWVADFRRLVVNGARSDARYYRRYAARIIADAARESQANIERAERSDRYSDDARTVANAVAREQRKAARS